MNTIEVLDGLIFNVRPHYYQALRPGLSAEKINEMSSKFGYSVPDQLSAMYQWKNGQDPNVTESFFRYENLTFSTLQTAFNDKKIVDEYLGEVGHRLTGKLLPFMWTGGNQWLCAASGIFGTPLYLYSGDEPIVESVGGLKGLLKKAIIELRHSPFRNESVDITVYDIEYRTGVEIAVDAVLKIGATSRKVIFSRWWHGAADALVLPFKSRTEEIDFYGGLDTEVIDEILKELAELVLPKAEKLGVDPKTGKPDFDPKIRVSPENKDAAQAIFSGAVYRFEINTWIKK